MKMKPLYFVNFEPITFRNEYKKYRSEDENGKDMRENTGRKKHTKYVPQCLANSIGVGVGSANSTLSILVS